MKIVKRDGFVQDYDETKVIRSLRNSGVSEPTIKKVLGKIEERAYEQISTDKLYALVYKLVSKYENKYSASIYSLKQALMRLGPDGYAFEDFIAKRLQNEGYDILTRQIYESNCITHELDVVTKDFFVECKYHNRGGLTTSVKDVMYSHARFLDLIDAKKTKGNTFKTFWIATNTHFSQDSIDYANYWKIKVWSWKYPDKDNLSQLIDEKQYYPVTLLPNVSRNIFSILSRHNILLIKEVMNIKDNSFKKMGLKSEEIAAMRNDCEQMMKASKRIRKE